MMCRWWWVVVSFFCIPFSVRRRAAAKKKWEDDDSQPLTSLLNFKNFQKRLFKEYYYGYLTVLKSWYQLTFCQLTNDKRDWWWEMIGWRSSTSSERGKRMSQSFWTDVQTTEKSLQSRTSHNGGWRKRLHYFHFRSHTLQKVSHKLGFLPKLES